MAMNQRSIRVQIGEVAADGDLPADLADAVSDELRLLLGGSGPASSPAAASVAKQIAAAIHQQLPPTAPGDGS